MAKGTFLRNQLAIIQTALESINAVITDKCGGHVHFGIEWLDTNLQSTEDFNLAQISHVRNNNNGFYASNKKDPMPFELMKNVGYRYGLNQQLINGILPNSRTNNTYCKPIDRQINSRDWKNATDIRTLDRIIEGNFILLTILMQVLLVQERQLNLDNILDQLKLLRFAIGLNYYITYTKQQINISYNIKMIYQLATHQNSLTDKVQDWVKFGNYAGPTMGPQCRI